MCLANNSSYKLLRVQTKRPVSFRLVFVFPSSNLTTVTVDPFLINFLDPIYFLTHQHDAQDFGYPRIHFVIYKLYEGDKCHRAQHSGYTSSHVSPFLGKTIPLFLCNSEHTFMQFLALGNTKIKILFLQFHTIE